MKLPVLGKTAKEVAVRRSNDLNWTSCRSRLELNGKRNVHIVRMQLYGVTYFISVTVHEIKHENITRHEKKHENMTYDPSNHLIILHRNLAYSEVSGGHNLHPRCRLRHCHSDASVF